MIRNPSPVRIGILLGEKENSFWWGLKSHLERYGQEKGMEICCFWPPTLDPLVGQRKILVGMVDQGFDLLVINPLNRENLIPGILTACGRKIPVLDVGAKTDSRGLPPGLSGYYPLKTVDFYHQGMLGGEYILRNLEDRVVQKVVIISGRVDAVQSQQRSKGAAETMEKFSKIKVHTGIYTDFDQKKAQKAAEELLREEPDINAFFCVNDRMALGVAEAVHRAGRQQEVITVGVDLIPEAREAIRSGRLTASVAFATQTVAKVILTSAQEVLEGRPLPDRYQVPSRVIDRSNLDTWESDFPSAV